MNSSMKKWSGVKFTLLVGALSALLAGCFWYDGHDHDRGDRRDHDRGGEHHEDDHR